MAFIVYNGQYVRNNGSFISNTPTVNPGIEFNGVDQVLYNDDSHFFAVDNGVDDHFCMALNITINSATFPDTDVIVTPCNLTSYTGKWLLYTNPTEGMRFALQTSNLKNPANVVFGTGNVPLEEKFHCFVHADLVNNKVYGYINGTLINPGGANITASIATGWPEAGFEFVLAGANKTDLDGYDLFSAVTLSDVRFFRTNVTSSISTMIAGNAVGGEVAWWKLSPGDYTDYSGGGRTLTPVGF